MTCHDAGRMLDAYIDDELPAADAAAIADHIQGCAACRERLGALESLGRLVRRIPYRAAPDRLRTVIAGAPRPARVATPTLAWAAAAMMAVALGGAVLYRTTQASRQTSVLAEDVVNAHVTALMRDQLFEVRSSNQHTVKPWFQGKLDFSPPVADLTPAGFPLVGGRMDTVAGRHAAALVYQRREHIINVFVWPADQQTKADVRSIRGFQERHWLHADLSVWAVSDLNAQELGEFEKDFEAAVNAP